MIHELRHYVAVDGRIGDLLDRFERHTLPLFRELGFEIVHFWHEAERQDHVWYLIAWRDEIAMKEGWHRLRESPAWREIKARTEASGPLVDRISRHVLREAGAQMPE